MLTLLSGTRVRLTCDVERFPDFIAPKGFTGTVRLERGALWLKLDLPVDGAEHWDNAVHFTIERGDVLSECMEVIA